MNLRRVLKRVLLTMGADGLINTFADCACDLDDLAPCEYLNLDECKPARKEGELYHPLKGVHYLNARNWHYHQNL